MTRLWSASQLAEAAGISRQHVAKLCRRKKIKAQKVGREWAIFDREALRWLREREEKKSQIKLL